MQEYLDFAARNPLLTAAWFGLAGTLVYTTVRARFSPVKTVNNHTATLLINRENATVVDIRSQEEFAKGHLAGAQHLNIAAITDFVEGCRFAQRLGLDPGTTRPPLIEIAPDHWVENFPSMLQAA